MKKPQLSPSVMCADPFELREVLDVFDRQGIEWLHIDVMDGHFVPNIALGTDYVERIRQHTAIPLDFHMMVQEPLNVLPWFDLRPGDIVAAHIESTVHFQRMVDRIRQNGAKPFAAINPATPIGMLEDVLPDLEGVLVMTVNPGFAGQTLIAQTVDKVARLRRWLNERGFPDMEIEVDGNVSFVNAVKMRKAGADIFVCGTSSVFSKEDTIQNNVLSLRKALR